jgi:glycine betaine/proline transport system ATP-binding protein
MQGLMLELQSVQKRTVLFVSHDLEEALRIGTRIGIMEGGLLVQEGTPHEIITRPANDYVRRFFKGVDTSRYLTAADLMDNVASATPSAHGPQVTANTSLPDTMKIVLAMDQPVDVIDHNEQRIGSITARSLLARISQESRHV